MADDFMSMSTYELEQLIAEASEYDEDLSRNEKRYVAIGGLFTFLHGALRGLIMTQGYRADLAVTLLATAAVIIILGALYLYTYFDKSRPLRKVVVCLQVELTRRQQIENSATT